MANLYVELSDLSAMESVLDGTLPSKAVKDDVLTVLFAIPSAATIPKLSVFTMVLSTAYNRLINTIISDKKTKRF